MFQSFRSLLSGQNPLGFGSNDFIMLGLAVLLVTVLLLREKLRPLAQTLAARTLLCLALLSILPVVLRLALLAHHPVPTPRVADDFSYLLLGDTLAHFRLANPMHPMHMFFEAVFVIHDPAYSSIYPLGQGFVLAFGQLVFRQPWIGVLLSDGALCGLCYWMLRAWANPAWALLGGLLATIQFGPLSPWMNTYWGGALSAIAGCLVFGALPRLRNAAGSDRTGASPGKRYAILLGTGLSLQLLTRPFEFLLVVVVVILYSAPLRSLMIAALVLLPAFGLNLLQNKQTTGSWTTLPYQLSRYQYGIPATFTIQPNPVPHRPLTVEQRIDYDAQVAVHGATTDTLGSYFARLATRIRFYRFFFPAPLYLVIPAFLLALTEYRFVWVLIALVLFWLGDAFYPYFYPHYIAAATCLFVLVTVKSLEILSRFKAGSEAITLILILCLADFAFWYGVHLSGNQNLLIALSADESWHSINYGDPEGRIAVNERLARAQGKQLVFVRYWPQHRPSEWIHNAAGIDQSPVVWAIDLGPAANETLRQYYPDRHAWLLEPDAHPPRLMPY